MKPLTKAALAVALNFHPMGLVNVKLSKMLPVWAETICSTRMTGVVRVNVHKDLLITQSNGASFDHLDLFNVQFNVQATATSPMADALANMSPCLLCTGARANTPSWRRALALAGMHTHACAAVGVCLVQKASHD